MIKPIAAFPMLKYNYQKQHSIFKLAQFSKNMNVLLCYPFVQNMYLIP